MFYDKNQENTKKILCFNILNNKICNYGNKCVYAHNLNDQKIDPLRQKVYTIINNSENLSNLNLINDQKLYETMLQLTRICNMCSKNRCPGGYNCRNGAINIKFKICFDDLVYGNCERYNCQSIHLTEKKLLPYNKQKNKNILINKVIDKTKLVEINDDIIGFDSINFHKNKLSYSDKLENVKGILLTNQFLMSKFCKDNKSVSSSDSETEENINKMITYFNNSDEE